MRRNLLLLLAIAGTLSGCAVSDRFAYARQDPVLWFLSGMPAPYDLNYQRSPIPDLPVLNPVDYVPVPQPQPLDYPRGWNPDNPPLLPSDIDGATVAPEPAVAQPDARCTVTSCTDITPPASATGVDAAGARPGTGAAVAPVAGTDGAGTTARP